MQKYKLGKEDIAKNYFHFTKRNNLESISQNGLIPKIGEHAELIEKTPKVFFVDGLDNLLILFDCWINVYKKVPVLSVTHNIGSKCMRSRYFPMGLVDIYFKLTNGSRLHKNNAYKIFDKLLEESILLNLDIKEEIDFKMSDDDEIKARGYKKRHLITLGYSLKYSDMNGTRMDRWNLHTLSNHGVSTNKIKLCYIDNSDKMKDIFSFALRNTKLNLKEICPVLYDYILSRNLI